MNLIDIVDYINSPDLLNDPGNVKWESLVKVLRINQAYNKIVQEIHDLDIELFYASVDQTPLTTGVALPVDFVRAKDIADENGYVINLVVPKQRHVLDPGTLAGYMGESGDYFAYLRAGNVYYSSSVIDTVTFGYYRRPPKLHRATATSGTATTIVFPATAMLGTVEDTDDYYNNGMVKIVSGTGSGQVRTVTDYAGSTRTATVSTWTTNPDSTSIYEIVNELPSDPDFSLILGDMVVARMRNSTKGIAVAEADLQAALMQLSGRNMSNCETII